MRKQTILSLAIISILPFAAKADPIGPAHVNSGAVVATASAPYAIAGEETGDTTNVVSASYVKGAYNDAISAINKVNSDKQDKLIDFESNNPMYNKVVGSGLNGVGNNLVYGSNDEYAAMTDDIARQATNNETGNLNEILISAGGAFNVVREAGQDLQEHIDTKQNKLTTHYGDSIPSTVLDYVGNHLGNVAYAAALGDTTAVNRYTDTINNIVEPQSLVTTYAVIDAFMATGIALNNKRVSALDTWGSNHTAEVALINHQ